MKPPPQQKTGWSLRRWGWVIAGLAAFQLLAFVLLSGNSRGSNPALRTAPPAIRMLTPPEKGAERFAVAPVDDPANAALVSPHGFSGPLWLSLPGVETRKAQWVEPPRWLQPEQTAPLSVTRQGLSLASLAYPSSSAHPPHAGAETRARAPTQTNSVLRLAGGLQRRPVLNPPDLPAWAFNDVLLPTTVQVLVDEQGRALAATLLSQSGLAAADQRALELSRALAFGPAPDSSPAGLDWGTVTFLWVAVESPAAGAAAPSPASPAGRPQ